MVRSPRAGLGDEEVRAGNPHRRDEFSRHTPALPNPFPLHSERSGGKCVCTRRNSPPTDAVGWWPAHECWANSSRIWMMYSPDVFGDLEPCASNAGSVTPFRTMD